MKTEMSVDKRENCMTFTIYKLFSLYYQDLNIYWKIIW